MSDLSDLPLENGDLKLETSDRDLECEYRENPDPPTGDLIPCEQPAEYAITTADYGEPTRVRYCINHVWNGISGWMERNG